MSIRMMTLVWEVEGFGPYERLVMLALADHCDDDGICYPSIRRICKRTGMKERGVQNVIKRLCEAGYVTVEMNQGRSGSNLYRITSTPASDAPPQEMHPRTGCTTPPHPITSTPASDAPKPSITINEPSDIDNARAKPSKHRLPENWVPSDADREYALSKNLTEPEIEEIADDFHAYWSDRTDASGKKSERGWGAAWRNRVRDQAPKFIRNRGVAWSSRGQGRGPGGGVAGEIARRRSGGTH